MGYLTPSSIPPDAICRVLLIPNNAEFIANVTGAIEALTFPENWFPQGLLTPRQSADALIPMFDNFCFAQGTCRMLSEIICLATPVSPDPKWLACEGSSLLIADYPDLYLIIGSIYGAVDGTHFNIPDFRGRVVVGVGSAPGLSVRNAGDIFGEEAHTLVAEEMPVHTHIDAGHSHSEITALANATTIGPGAPQPTAVPGVGSTGVGSAALNDAGLGLEHNNIQPSLVLCYYIVALP